MSNLSMNKNTKAEVRDTTGNILRPGMYGYDKAVTDARTVGRNFPVKIHDMTKTPTLVYIARMESHCHDPIDAEAFRLCRRFGDVITLGKVIAEPAYNL